YQANERSDDDDWETQSAKSCQPESHGFDPRIVKERLIEVGLAMRKIKPEPNHDACNADRPMQNGLEWFCSAGDPTQTPPKGEPIESPKAIEHRRLPSRKMPGQLKKICDYMSSWGMPEDHYEQIKSKPQGGQADGAHDEVFNVFEEIHGRIAFGLLG